MRLAQLLLVLVAFTVAPVLQGCVESTHIRAYPPDAQIAVNGQALGTSPVVYSVPRGRWPKDGYFHYHVERAGYHPQDGTFTSKPAAGRITGGIFTLGLLFLIKSPTALPEEIEVILQPVATTAPAASEYNPSVPAEQIRRLEELLDRGAITEEEFKRQRNKILRNL